MSHFSLNSQFTKKKYDINVYVPDGIPPMEGFPIYYVLDGLSYFTFVRDVVRLQMLNRIKTGVPPAIVIGICHQEVEMREQRFIDFTAPSEKLVVPPHAKGKLPPGFGGAEEFFQFIMNELKPCIEEQYPVNQRDQTIFGHSLGGYFALWCLFTKCTAFTNYIAISPSVWWNDEELLKLGEKFLEKNEGFQQHKVFIGVGEQEGFMVDGAKKMAYLLNSHLPVEHYVAPDENHASVVPTVISRAIRFCYNGRCDTD